MGKIQKENPPKFLIVPDTNILWYEDKSYAVNPLFEQFINDNKSLASLELIIPDMVKQELLFQQTTSALKALEKINENVSLISQITRSQHKLSITRDQIKKQIESKFDSWISLNKASVAKTPYEIIDLNKVCYKAVWHLPPFTFDPKNNDNEKGFRDAIILETVIDLSNKKKSDCVLVFLCNDVLLKKTALEIIKKDKTFLCYETLPDFGSYLRLTKEKLTNEFIEAISARAERKFYTLNDPKCLFNRTNIGLTIAKDYESDINNPSEEKYNLLSSLTQKNDGSIWKPSNIGNWWLPKPEFEKIEGTHEYHWKSILTMTRNFRKVSSKNISEKKRLLDLLDVNNKTLFLHFNILWKSIVKNDGRFYNIELEKIELSNKEFRYATQEEMISYSINYEENS